MVNPARTMGFVSRTVVLAAALAAATLALLLWRPWRSADTDPSPAPAPPAKFSPSREPETLRASPRRRHPIEEDAPVVAAPSPAVPDAPVAPPPAERRFLGGRTAAEIKKPFDDVPPRMGAERFRDDMVPSGALCQLSDLVAEDFDRAQAAFTAGTLATIEKNGGRAIDADRRQTYEESSRAYWSLIVDLQRRVAGLSDRLRLKDYRDEAERETLQLRQVQIADVADRLNRERIAEELRILKPYLR